VSGKQTGEKQWKVGKGTLQTQDRGEIVVFARVMGKFRAGRLMRPQS